MGLTTKCEENTHILYTYYQFDTETIFAIPNVLFEVCLQSQIAQSSHAVKCRLKC